MNCQVVNCSLDGTEKIIGLHEMSNGVVIESKEMLCKKHADIL